MFVDGGFRWEPPEPWQPPRRSRISRRQERIVLRLVGLMILLLLVAPIGGATLIEAGIACWRAAGW